MEYEFSLNKKKAAILISGLGLLGVLLFVAGFLIGYGSRPSVLPAGPLMARDLTKVKLAPMAVTKTLPFAKPLQANPPAAASKTNGSNPAPVSANTSPPAPAPAPTTAPSPSAGASEAGPSEIANVSTPAQATDAAQKAYSIQMGAFLDPNNAARLVKNLKGLGYDATIFKAPDRRGRIWEAVRFGRFNDLHDALRAATEFRTKEQMFALVRPADTL